MPVLTADASVLLLIDVQGRLVPALHDGVTMVAEIRRLVAAAAVFGVPVLATEQNPSRLGPTMAEIGLGTADIVEKMTFDCTRTPGFLERLPPDRAVVVTGCEAHVCVLQTVLGVLATGRRVALVRDGIMSRRPESREAGIARMVQHGAEVVTAEMVVFEWLGGADHPRFKDALALVK